MRGLKPGAKPETTKPHATRPPHEDNSLPPGEGCEFPASWRPVTRMNLCAYSCKRGNQAIADG